MSSLNACPDDALSVILELSQLAVISLWMTGDSLLRTRIVRSCRSVSTDQSMLFHKSLKRWPRMFSQLTALRSLQIGVTSILEDIDIVSAQIRSLSPTLEVLNLSFYRANQILLRSTPSPNLGIIISRFWNRLTSSEDATINDTQPSSSACWSVAERFPRLTELTLSCHLVGYSWPTVAVPLSEVDAFGSLPESLHTLTWNGLVHAQSTFSDFSLLPRGLKSLSLGGPNTPPIVIHTAATAATLPPRLTHLTNRVHNSDALAALPRTLIEGFSSSWLHYHPTAAASMLAAIPPMVPRCEDLDVSSLAVTHPRRWPELLPKFLTTFSAYNHRFTADEIEMLPRTIINLYSLGIVVQSFKTRSENPQATHALWPPRLCRTRFLSDSGVESAEDMQYLPPTLTDIFHLEGPHVLSSLGRCFPQLVRYSSSLPVFLVNIIQPLPDTLVRLELYLSQSPQISRIEPQSFQMMPHGLKVLYLHGAAFTTPESSLHLEHLPRTIEDMIVQSLHVSAFDVLPPTLTRLSAQFLCGDVTQVIPTYLHLPPIPDLVEIERNSQGRQWF